jgi:SagB-type dehydrogenase family enzyme
MSTARNSLTELVDLLSDAECEQIAPLFRDVAEGQRFWERDLAVYYNEHAKARPIVAKRPLKVDRNIAPGPVSAEEHFVAIPIVRRASDDVLLTLPEPRPLDASLTSALSQRRSRRTFSGASIALADLATFLGHAAGVTGRTPAYGFTQLPQRPFPSSGGLGSPELYVCVHRVDNLPPGVYRYAPTKHALEIVQQHDVVAFLAKQTFGQTFVEQGALTLVLTGVYERLRWKYGERGYRYMCMDAGFLGQSLYLVGEAMGLGVCAIAGFYDEGVEKVLEIDATEETEEMVLLLISVGVPTAEQ